MNIIDRAISFFSPTLALKRQLIREELATRSYTGASTGRRVQDWKTTSSSANSEVLSGLVTIRNRARDLERNNPYATRLINGISSNVIGTGILPSCTDEVYLDLFEKWADSLEVSIDGKTNLYGIQNQAGTALVRDGEILIIKTYSKSTNFPLQLKVLESDYLDHSKHDPASNLYMGVQKDEIGRIEGYWIFTNHPGETNSQSVLFPTSDVIHLFKQDRAGQTRGISWLAPVILSLRKLTDYTDAILEKLLISNLFVGVIEDPNADSITTDTPLSLEPGAIITLPPSKSISFSTPPDAGNSQAFLTYMLREISTALCFPFEMLSGDLSQVNFSTSRMSQAEFGRFIDSIRWLVLIPQFLNQIHIWFFESLVLSGQYNGERPVMDWTPPRRISVDFVREEPILIEAIKNGTTTLSEVLREKGFNVKKHLEEYKNDMALLDELGIHLGIDLRKDSDTKKAEASTITAEAAQLAAESKLEEVV